jgi:hypothetical protein
MFGVSSYREGSLATGLGVFADNERSDVVNEGFGRKDHGSAPENEGLAPDNEGSARSAEGLAGGKEGVDTDNERF